MGQCFAKQDEVSNTVKQNKNIDDKRMLKVGVEVMKRDFCVQIGYNRRAVKSYSSSSDGRSNTEVPPREDLEEPSVS